MEKIPTADEFLNKEYYHIVLDSKNTWVNVGDIERAMVEFAKLHVEQALKEASKKARLARAFDYGSYYEPTAKFKPIDEKVVVKESYGHGDSGYEAVKIDTDSILSSYSLENIK